MSKQESQSRSRLSPFAAVLQDGANRMLEVIKSDPFTFLVNGVDFASTVAEAVLLSDKVYDQMLLNPFTRLFEVSIATISSADFGLFLSFLRSGATMVDGRDQALRFLSISSALSNAVLSSFFLSSLCPSGSTPLSRVGEGESDFDFDCFGVDWCASRFFCYSREELASLARIDREFLHRLLSSENLRVESEDSLLRLLLEVEVEVDVEVDRSEFLCHIEVSFLSSDGLSLFLHELTFEDLTESIWAKIVIHLKGDGDQAKAKEMRQRRFVSPSTSVIVSGIPSILKDLESKEWTLLYRGSRDGFSGSAFHTKCDGHSTTVTYIETTKGFIFGGFTPVAWDSSNSDRADNSGQSFLFSLKNPRGSVEQKFSLSDPTFAIRCISSYGPTFGGGHDIHLSDGCDTNTTSYTDFGYSYANPTGIEGKSVLAGERNFTVKEVEVFSIRL
jgi:hypothetical protein